MRRANQATVLFSGLALACCCCVELSGQSQKHTQIDSSKVNVVFMQL